MKETVYSDGGFYEKPKCIKQAEIDKEIKNEVSKKTYSN